MVHASPSRHTGTGLPTLLGLTLLALGVAVQAGWLLQIRALVEIRPGSVAMVFNTALCFTLTGIALAAPGLRRRPTPGLQTAIGAFLLLFCTLLLGEHLFDLDLHLDWAWLHRWLHDGNIRPGRIAPNSALGFMLIGATLLVMNRVQRKWQASATQTLTFGVLAIGLTGLLGYTLAPDLLFGWARSARMALPTAGGMIIASIALWAHWHHANWYQSDRFFRDDEKIRYMGTAILAVVTFTAGMTGFVYQQHVLEKALGERLAAALRARIELFRSTIAADSQAASIAGRLFAVSSSGDADADRVHLAGLAENLLGEGFNAIAIYDRDGVLRAQAGSFKRTPEISARLDADRQARLLLWQGDLYLQTDSAIVDRGVTIGRLRAQQPLARLRRALFDTAHLGRTDEIALCKGERDTLFCFPEGAQPHAFRINRVNLAGRPLPMNYAIGGQQGLVASIDYRGRNVMAAYGPLAPNLGLVVKQETTELYGAIRDQLTAVVPALLGLIVLGSLVLRGRLRSLALRLIASEATARQKELEVSAVMANAGEGILTVDHQGVIASFNTAAAQMFGYTTAEAIGMPVGMLVAPELRDACADDIQRYLAGGSSHYIDKQGVELTGVTRSGTPVALELSISAIGLDRRRLYVAIVHDITQRKRTEQKLVFLAQYDSLTGLPNRALFLDRLSGAQLRANRSGSGMALMFLDIDGFKAINDRYGHHSGDELLRAFGARLGGCVRKTDSVARLAGDEFTVILEGLAEPDVDTPDIADKIVAAMQAEFVLTERAIRVTTSIGIARHRPGALDVDDLLRRADHAMYQAKNSGKNRWYFDRDGAPPP